MVGWDMPIPSWVAPFRSLKGAPDLLRRLDHRLQERDPVALLSVTLERSVAAAQLVGVALGASMRLNIGSTSR